MPEFGFPAQPRHASLASLVASLRQRSGDARVAAITGRHADLTKTLDGRVNEVMQMEKSIGDLRGYGDAIALSEARASVMQGSLDRLTAAGQSLADAGDLLMTNGTDADFAIVSGQARAEIGSVVAALNVRFGDRALFAGDDAGGIALADGDTIFTSSVPFLEGATGPFGAYSALEAEFMDPGGLYDTSFYQGGNGDAPVTEVAPGERIAYGVKADEAPARRLLFNVVVLAAAHDTSNAIPDDQRRELVRFATEGLRTAAGELTHVQARLGTAEARIANVKARNIAAEASLSIQLNGIAGADQYESAVELTQLEGQIETAFATTARLSNLSLANFR